jgi:hypothetical protein
MSFLKISEEILEVSKKYGDINPEIQNIFEISFLTFMEIIKSLDKNLPINEGTIKSKVFDDLFGPYNPKNKQGKQGNQCGMTPSKESSEIDTNLFAEITGKSPEMKVSVDNFGGFDPNVSPDQPDMDLLSDLKNKIQNINKEKLNDKTKEVTKNFKSK